MHFENDTLLHGGLFELPSLSDERLQVSITSVVWVNGTWLVTVTIRFAQFEGTPEIPKTFYVYFLPEGASESEKLKFAPILESRIENGVASLSFNATENGTVAAKAEFAVGLEPSFYTVTSNPVSLICKWGLCACLYLNVKLYHVYLLSFSPSLSVISGARP